MSGVGAGRRVLLVDDAADIRMLVRLVLEDSGFLVEEAQDGASGLAAAAGLPDVVLLDVQLPDVDGPELLRALRADPRTAALPVVFLTGERGGEQSLTAAGALGVLHKPLDLDSFADVLAALL